MSLLEQYYDINDAGGVSIHILADGSLLINACRVKVNKKQLTFEERVTDVEAFEDLGRHFPPKTFISLNLSGKGVLQKQVEKIAVIDHQQFGKILPNANPDDFYIQNFISGERSFISLIRKAEAERYIEWLKKMDFVPLMLSLGVFPFDNVINQVNVYEDEIKFAGHHIQRNEKKEWVTVNYREDSIANFPLKIELENIDEKLVLPYAAVFQLLLRNKLDPVIADVPSLEKSLEKVEGERKFKTHGFVMLAAFLLLLIINFLVFSWYNDANARLSEQLGHSAQNSDDLQKVGEQVAKKDSLLKLLGWEENIRKSKLIDQLASSLPAELSWSSAAVDPVKSSEGHSRQTIAFFNRTIRITGSSERIIPVNEWMARIKTNSWVKNVQLDHYTFDNELNTGRFTVIIDY